MSALARIEAIITENQKRIDATRDLARTIEFQTGPIRRDGKDISLRQEVADAKTLGIAAQARDEAILEAIQAAAGGAPIDLAAVTKAAEEGVSRALRSINADVTVTVQES